MRDPARIDRICDLLRAYWHAHPDLRLGQIVGNFTPGRIDAHGRPTGEPGESYYVEDDIIEAALVEATPRLPVCPDCGCGWEDGTYDMDCACDCHRLLLAAPRPGAAQGK